MLGTSDAWSMSCLSHQPIDPAYYIEDCRICDSSCAVLLSKQHEYKSCKRKSSFQLKPIKAVSAQTSFSLLSFIFVGSCQTWSKLDISRMQSKNFGLSLLFSVSSSKPASIWLLRLQHISCFVFFTRKILFQLTNMAASGEQFS